MKNVEDESQSSLFDYYDSIVMDYQKINDFIKSSNPEELIKLYKYVCRRAAELKEEAKDMIPFYWLASQELENTDAIKMYLNGEITEEHLEAYEAQKQAEIDSIVKLLEERKKAKSPLGRLKKMFSPTSTIKKR